MDEKKRGHLVIRKSFLLITTILTLILAGVVFVVLTTPDAGQIKECLRTSLYNVWLCETNNPNYRSINSISPYLRNLILISEDSAFYGHNGFDWGELRLSLEKNLQRGRAVRGGSTISQQLAKNVFLNSEKSFTRKVREAFLTVQIETLLTKDKIFEKYLNVIEFGPNIYGAESAAQHYFKKSASDLNLLEAAYLTFLIPNPKIYSATYQKGQLTPFSRSRIIDLCFRLMKTSRITEDQYEAAKKSLELFPWFTLPADLQTRLTGNSRETEIHDVIDESTFEAPASDMPTAEPKVDDNSVTEPDDAQTSPPQDS